MGMAEFNNVEFKTYVDKYCRTYRINKEEALKHKLSNQCVRCIRSRSRNG